MKNSTKKILIVAGVGLSAFLLWKWWKKRNGCTNCGKLDNIFSTNLNSPTTVYNKIKRENSNDLDALKRLNVAERIMKLESANYTSNIYNHTKGGGFIAVTKTFPYGFVSCEDIWNEKGKPTGLYKSSNGNDYIKFPSLYIGVYSIMELLKGYNKNGYTTAHYNEGDQDYMQKIRSYDEENLITETIEDNEYLDF